MLFVALLPALVALALLFMTLRIRPPVPATNHPTLSHAEHKIRRVASAYES